jgi:Uncharacterized enzyme involved in biosynthesis of extracellular polysaccharides
MIAVIFELAPADGHRQEYLDIAAQLRPLLDGIDGFISIERFESLTTPGKSSRCRSGAMKMRWRTGGTWSGTGSPRPAAAPPSSTITGCAWPA